MKKKLIAKRYAEALFAFVKNKENTMLPLYNDALVYLVQACYTNPSLFMVLSSPIVTHHEKENIIKALFKDTQSLPYFINFCTILIHADRIDCIKEIASAYQTILNQYKENCIANVTTAIPLDDEDKALLASSLTMLGKTVELNYSVEPSILGGMILAIGDIHIDASLRNELDSIREHIIKGGCYAN